MPAISFSKLQFKGVKGKPIAFKTIGNEAGDINPAFITTWKTDNAGDTASDSIRIPLVSGESYDFDVDWGDGNSETVTGSALTQKDHTYASAGTYTVTITGTFPRIYFNNGGDKLKLLTIENLGDVGWTSFENAFFGCSNNTKVAGDVVWDSVTSCAGAWFSNSLTSWTIDLPASLTTCRDAWSKNSLTSWTVDLPASLTTCFNAWSNNPLTSWTVDLPASLTSCAFAWRKNNLTSWTVDLPASLMSCVGAWRDNAIISWTGGGWAGVTDATDALFGNTLDTDDYNNLLVTIETNNQNNSVSFHGGNSQHSGAGTTARTALINDHSWTITDGGPA